MELVEVVLVGFTEHVGIWLEGGDVSQVPSSEKGKRKGRLTVLCGRDSPPLPPSNASPGKSVGSSN